MQDYESDNIPFETSTSTSGQEAGDGFEPGSDDILNKDAELSDSFFSLTKELRKKFAIHKGVLVIRHDNGGRLSAISTWRNGSARDGLALKFPVEGSLFEKVAQQGQLFSDDYYGEFSGNFFERKLLLDDDSRSFAVQPLKADGRVIGLLGYSSRRPTAFTALEGDKIDRAAEKFGSIIESKTLRR